MNIEERMQDLEKQVNEITETAARLRETFEREQKQTASGVPEIGQRYWFLKGDGSILTSLRAYTTEDHGRLAFGNVYLTEAEAIKARNQKLAEVKVITRLRELDKGFVADWRDEMQLKHSPYFNHTKNKFFVEEPIVCRSCHHSWTSTQEAWEQVIKEMESAVKLMMGVEV